MIGRALGIGRAAREVGAAVGGVAEIFAGNRAAREAAEHERHVRVLAQFAEEFSHPATRPFDAFVNGMNRLPRPLMALGTMVLFGYSMVEPEGFALRMQGLSLVPEPLWWLLGAIVGFYFGARELHHYRCRSGATLEGAAFGTSTGAAPEPRAGEAPLRLEAAKQPATLAAPPAAAPAIAAPQPQAAPVQERRPLPAAPAANAAPEAKAPPPARSTGTAAAARAGDPDHNAALEEWRARRA